MGFPRIISKNNKIYTKLGEFCLSGDGNQFWIVCHTCQEELQTQGQFWKHIQDEHNFLHGIKQEQAGAAYMDTNDTAGNIMPLPLYRKVSITDQQQQQRQDTNSGGEDEEVQKEAKDYTEMRSHEVDNTATVAIDIKLEPSSLSQSLPASEQVQQQHQQQQQQQQQHTTTQHNPQQQLDMSAAAPLMYQIPQIHPPVSAYGALVQVPTIKYEIAAVAAAASHHQQQQHMPTSMAAALMSQDLSKDNMSNNNNNNNTTTNSTTASASSAVSSDDGERWYICDFENCGLKFKYQSRLELHRSVHSKERRFACEICGASFKQSCNLSTHRKKKHALKGIKSSLVLPQRF